MRYYGKGGKLVRLDDALDFYRHFNDERTNLVTLQTITGGKGTGVDWLSPLPVGAIFLVKDNLDASNFMMLRLEIDHKYTSSVLLTENITGKTFGCVVPDRFCQRFRLAEVLYRPQEEENNNGESDR